MLCCWSSQQGEVGSACGFDQFRRGATESKFWRHNAEGYGSTLDMILTLLPPVGCSHSPRICFPSLFMWLTGAVRCTVKDRRCSNDRVDFGDIGDVARGAGGGGSREWPRFTDSAILFLLHLGICSIVPIVPRVHPTSFGRDV